MSRKLIYKSSFIGAVTAFLGAAVMVLFIPVPESGLNLQPSFPPVPDSEFIRAANSYPVQSLQFFTADSFFILGYLMVFVGLYTTTKTRSTTFASLGLGAGILTAFFDTLENSFFITYAYLARNGTPLTDPALPSIYIVSNIKWMCAFAAITAFCLVWPRDSGLDWAITASLALFVIIGILGTFLPGLVNIRGLFFLIGMILFAVTFWKRGHLFKKYGEEGI